MLISIVKLLGTFFNRYLLGCLRFISHRAKVIFITNTKKKDQKFGTQIFNLKVINLSGELKENYKGDNLYHWNYED